MIITISGPSGSGKTKFTEEFEKLGYKNIKLYTTRPKRPEDYSKDVYHFVTIKEFTELRESGEFLNIESYDHNRFYALPRKEIENALLSDEKYILPCTPRGLREIKNNFHFSLLGNLKSIYLTASLDIRVKRYLSRFEPETFKLEDLSELNNRAQMDTAKFDGFDLEVDYIYENNYELDPYDFRNQIQTIEKVLFNEYEINDEREI